MVMYWNIRDGYVISTVDCDIQHSTIFQNVPRVFQDPGAETLLDCWNNDWMWWYVEPGGVGDHDRPVSIFVGV
jgi:hypothetical protein